MATKKMLHPSPILSIIITAHAEGLLAHKTLLSIERSITTLSVECEIIVSLDNADEATRKYVESHTKKFLYQILDVKFGDLSASRNNAVSHSRGDYIAFVDADDLVSKNWLSSGLTLARTAKSSVIIHPEYSVTFGDANIVWKKRSSNDRTFDTLCLVGENLWDSPCIAARSIFTDTPYHPNGGGIGYEDKHFNCETLAANVRHIVAPETALFVRRKQSGSLLEQSSSSFATIAKTALLSFNSIFNINLAPYEITRKRITTPSLTVRDLLIVPAKMHRYLLRFSTYSSLMRPLREYRQSKLLGRVMGRYPTWLIDEWRSLHKIENLLFPSKETLKHAVHYSADNDELGILYAKLIQSLSSQPDTLFFVPHIIKGGADMLFINYSTELADQHSDWHIAMLQTELKESVWKDRLSSNIDFVDIHKLLGHMSKLDQERIISTLMVQSGIKRIIVGNSQFAYDLLETHKNLIRTLNIAVYCFAFGEEYDDEGRLWGHIHTGIPKIHPIIHRIITDNKNTQTKLISEYGYDEDLFAVHYQPTANIVKPIHLHEGRPTIRILWASRVCKQKRPDILKSVSNLLDENYVVDAYGQLEEGLTQSYFSDSRVNYRGPYDGSSSLPTEDYDIFIYTSEGDGVPNILQEMSAAGLPIVASNVGGIHEIIKTDFSGCLIEDHNNIESYVEAVKQLAQNPKLRKRCVQGAQNLLATQFSKEAWGRNVSEAFDR